MSEAEEGKEKGMETFWLQTSKVTTSRKIASGHLLAVWLQELKLGLCNNLEESDGVGGGREVQEGEDICIPMADPCWCMAETNNIVTILQLKIKKNKKECQ